MYISLNIPSNNPDSFFNILLPSLEHLDELRNNDENIVELFLIAQPPWERKEIEAAGEEVAFSGFAFDYRYMKYILSPSMTYLRNTGIINSYYSDYYIMVDDNFCFTSGTPKYPQSSGKRYLQCINYLEDNKDCGFVMCEGALGGYAQKWEISSTTTGLFATTRGIVLRNIGAEKLFRKSTHLIGGLEESVVCYHIIEEGYYPAKQFNNPTQHKDKAKRGEVKSSIHDKNIWLDNCQWYIRTRYEDPHWHHSSKRWPKGLKKKFIEKGGDERVFKKRIKIIDYKE